MFYFINPVQVLMECIPATMQAAKFFLTKEYFLWRQIFISTIRQICHRFCYCVFDVKSLLCSRKPLPKSHIGWFLVKVKQQKKKVYFLSILKTLLIVLVTLWYFKKFLPLAWYAVYNANHVACVAWRFCREQYSPQFPRGFFTLARLY